MPVTADNIPPPKPPTISVPSAVSAPSLDAAGSGAGWGRAAVIDGLTLAVGPDAAKRTPFPTEIRLLWDADHLYIRFNCRGGDAWAPFGAKWGAPHYQGDVVEIFLDPVGDCREFTELEVSPENGVFSKLYLATSEPKSRADGILAEDFLRRDEWEVPDWPLPGLQTFAARAGSEGEWRVIVVLPAKPVLRRLGATHFAAGMTFHANFLRYERGLASDGDHKPFTAMNWAPSPWGRPHRAPSLMGSVTLAAP